MAGPECRDGVWERVWINRGALGRVRDKGRTKATWRGGRLGQGNWPQHPPAHLHRSPGELHSPERAAGCVPAHTPLPRPVTPALLPSADQAVRQLASSGPAGQQPGRRSQEAPTGARAWGDPAMDKLRSVFSKRQQQSRGNSLDGGEGSM